MTNKNNSDNSIGVFSADNECTLHLTSNSSAYYSALAKDWAIKVNGTVDEEEYSAKYYAQKAKTAEETADLILSDTGIQLISQDLTGDNKIGTCADNIVAIRNSASNALLAQEKAAEASQTAAKVNLALMNMPDASLSNLTEAGKEMIQTISQEELNNPYTLFDSKYSESPLYNASWLLSNGTYHSGTVYVTAYEALQVEYNSEIEAGTTVTLPSGTSYTKRGLSVKSTGDNDITDYDFVINTTDTTFRLPVKTKYKPVGESNPVVGNGYTLGMVQQDGTLFGTGISTPSYTVLSPYTGYFGKRTDKVVTSSGKGAYQGSYGIGVPTAEQLGDKLEYSGLIVCNSDTAYLYFYIGETVQNANLIDAGRIAEQISAYAAGNIGIDGSGLVTSSENSTSGVRAVTQTYINGTSGYRVYSDGFKVQWGQDDTTNKTITFLLPFSNTNYVLIGPGFFISGTGRQTISKAADKFSTGSASNNSGTDGWIAFGY